MGISKWWPQYGRYFSYVFLCAQKGQMERKEIKRCTMIVNIFVLPRRFVEALISDCGEFKISAVNMFFKAIVDNSRDLRGCQISSHTGAIYWSWINTKYLTNIPCLFTNYFWPVDGAYVWSHLIDSKIFGK